MVLLQVTIFIVSTIIFYIMYVDMVKKANDKREIEFKNKKRKFIDFTEKD